MAKVNQESEPVRKTRRTYIYAVLASVGVPDETAQSQAEALAEKLENRKIPSHPALSYQELPKEDADRLTEIGRRALRGSSWENDYAKSFWMGRTLVDLLNEEPGSSSYQYLGGWILYMTDGLGGQKFEEITGIKPIF